MLRLLDKSQIMESHRGCNKVQDPYSLRCIPQVHGVVRDVLRSVEQVLRVEANSVTDNPLVFAKEGKILSGGNFHGEYPAMAMDQLAIAVAELASISEERIAKLINPALSELPPFLAKDSGLNSGFMIVHVAAASLVSENKIYCHPAVVDSIPTSADKEDHVSMGTIAAVKCRRVVDNTWSVIAMEYLCASQGLEFHKPLKPGRAVNRAYEQIRKTVPPVDRDRAFYIDRSQNSQPHEREPAMSAQIAASHGRSRSGLPLHPRAIQHRGAPVCLCLHHHHPQHQRAPGPTPQPSLDDHRRVGARGRSEGPRRRGQTPPPGGRRELHLHELLSTAHVNGDHARLLPHASRRRVGV